MTAAGRRCAKIFSGFCCLLLLVGSINACGYRFSRGGELPGNISRVVVETFENRSGEIGIESIITNDIIYEVTRSGKVQVTRKEAAQAVLSGVIRSAQSTDISHVTATTTAERRITVTVEVKLARPGGETLWSGSAISASETYAVAGDKLRTEQNKKSAVAKLSGRLAQRIFYRITDDF